jgi:hypothetical protein
VTNVVSANLDEFAAFAGTLSLGNESVDLQFKLRFARSGEIEFRFEELPYNDKTRFILKEWSNHTSRPLGFSLRGTAEDGSSFTTDSLALQPQLKLIGSRELTIEGECTEAKIVRPQSATDLPHLVMKIRGFANLGLLSADCELGKVTMNGGRIEKNDDLNWINGFISVRPTKMPEDLMVWRSRSEELLEHIRKVMSLASATMLKAPIRFFVHDGKWEIHAMSQSQQQRASLRIVHDVDQEQIFGTAVRTFFKPAIAAKNIAFAIEWFAMDAGYNETRLINAMTALENLLNSNLSEADKDYYDGRAFRRIKREIRQCMLERVGSSAFGGDNPETDALSTKLNDLNRKPLIDKIYLLATYWSVPIDDLDRQKISRAIGARNKIVHRGQYYDDGRPNDSVTDLWDHAMLIRELVTRLILTSYGYIGPYCTFIGGFKNVNFPPETKSAG